MTAAIAPDLAEPQPFPTELWLRNVGIFIDEWRDLALLTIHRDTVMEMLQMLHDNDSGCSRSRLVWHEDDAERDMRRSLVTCMSEQELIRWQSGPAEFPASAPLRIREQYPTSYAHLTPEGRAVLRAKDA